MKKIVIVGYLGKMGQLLFKELSFNYNVDGIDKNDNIDKVQDCDLIIDFSTGENSAKTAKWCEKNKKPLIIGATGQKNNENRIIESCSKSIPILKSGNFSNGIFQIKNMLKKIDIKGLESITIFEKHHKYKKDKPSGTAIELAKYCESILKTKADICALRGGEEIGTHEISLYYESEVVKISHQAFSRKVFIKGVLEQIEYMLTTKKKGLIDLKN